VTFIPSQNIVLLNDPDSLRSMTRFPTSVRVRLFGITPRNPPPKAHMSRAAWRDNGSATTRKQEPPTGRSSPVAILTAHPEEANTFLVQFMWQLFLP
jgi:hypothetical protein